MARLFDDTSSQYLTATLANAITAFPITMFVNGYDTDGSNNDRALIDIGNGVSTTHVMRLGLNDADQRIRAGVKFGTGGAPKFARSTGNAPTNAWFSAAGEFGSTTSRFAILDGVRGPEDTTATTGTFANMTIVTLGIELAPLTDPWDGRMAEAAIWNVTLTDAEHEALALGYSPKLIRPSALIFYDALVSGVGTTGAGNSTDLIEGLVMVDNNGVGLADHPPIIYNSRPQIFRQVAAGAPSSIPVIMNHLRNQGIS